MQRGGHPSPATSLQIHLRSRSLRLIPPPSGRSTRSGTEFSPLTFENAAPSAPPAHTNCLARAVLFMGFAPLLHQYYTSTLDSLCSWDAFFPPRPSTLGLTLPHIDFGNLAWGWCAMTALGAFDPDCGGHLILGDLKLIIRFPPASTILLPSAILRHSNTKIQRAERWYLFTQFHGDLSLGVQRLSH
ncbi:hypothetical protein FB451DRAFT_1421733 [Mycena latifolia]|nr:hypothetical protein FB451DRAFT_1421733 [Mycena latifolia]